MNATVYTYIDKAAALRETAEQQLFYVIGNSVGIFYYIKRHCVPESAVHGEKNVLLYYFRNANEKLFVLWHY